MSIVMDNNRYMVMNIHRNILREFRKEKIVTSSEIASKFKISWNTAEKYLLELVIEGKLQKIKKLGVNLWMLK
jgi:ribosomal protein S25